MRKYIKFIFSTIVMALLLVVFSIKVNAVEIEISKADLDAAVAANGGATSKGITYNSDYFIFNTDGTYKLKENITLTGEDTILFTCSNAVLNLNGKTLSSSEDGTVIASSSVVLKITGNGTIKSSGYNDTSVYAFGKSKVIIENGTFGKAIVYGLKGDYPSLTINNGRFTCLQVSQGNLIVNNATVQATDSDAVYVWDEGSAVINGGTFKSPYNGLMAETVDEEDPKDPKKVEINGGYFIGDAEGGLNCATKYTKISAGKFKGGYTAIMLEGENAVFENLLAEGSEFSEKIKALSVQGYPFKYTEQKEIEVKKKITWKNPFKDVKESDWFYAAVKYTNENKIISGYNATTFAPNDNLTRAMMVTILYRMDGAPKNDGKSKFADVTSTEWYSQAIKWAVDNGIVHGYAGTNNFGPNDNIIRQDLAGILRNYAVYKKKNTNVAGDITKFKDHKSVSDYALTSMKWAVGAGVITGNADGTLNPKGNATRAEAAAMIVKYCTKVGK